MGVHRVLVSLLDFKSSVAGHKLAGWVRFPHAPANLKSTSSMAFVCHSDTLKIPFSADCNCFVTADLFHLLDGCPV
jgi:hypothetical protein